MNVSHTHKIPGHKFQQDFKATSGTENKCREATFSYLFLLSQVIQGHGGKQGLNFDLKPIETREKGNE